MMTAIVLLTSIALAYLVPCQASSHYKAYETISQRVEGNNKLTAEKIYIIVDSSDDKLKPTPEMGMTNTIEGLDRSPSAGTISTFDAIHPKRIKMRKGWSHRHNLIGNTDYDANSPNSVLGHQSLVRQPRPRPRTVESPALSVDTGQARSSSPSVRLANNIKKLFNVEEGHYSDIYDRIDKHKPLTKKKPAEKLDERLGLASRH